MQEFKCRFEGHEDEPILGFCINMHCQKCTQFCFKCLTKVHFDHIDDCLRFNLLSDLVNNHITKYTNLVNSYNDIKSKLELLFQENQQYIKKLITMDQELKNKSYLSVKEQIPFIKQLEQQGTTEEQRSFIIELNKTYETFKVLTNEKLKIQQDGGRKSNHIKQQEPSIFQEKQKAQELQLKDELKKKQIVGRQLLDNEQNQEASKSQSDSLIDNISQGNALFKLNRFEEAIQFYDIALNINPNYLEALQCKGIVLDELNRFEEAIQFYDKALNINPNNWEVLFNKGLTLFKLNRFEEAIQFYDKVLNINPINWEALFNKGIALLNLNHFEEAIQFCNEALDINQVNLDK